MLFPRPRPAVVEAAAACWVLFYNEDWPSHPLSFCSGSRTDGATGLSPQESEGGAAASAAGYVILGLTVTIVAIVLVVGAAVGWSLSVMVGRT